MNAYYKETEKPFGYLLVDSKPNTLPDKQILVDLFGECYDYHFGVNVDVVKTQSAGRKRRDHFGKKVNCTKVDKCNYSPGRKQPTHPN